MLKKTNYLFLLSLPLLWGCIGTDVVDIELVEEKLTINTRLSTLAVGESYEMMADYFNQFGEKEGATISWSSSNDQIISIDIQGLAEAHSVGEVTITATYMGAEDNISVVAGDQTAEVSQRSGSFMGANRYTVNGRFNLLENTEELLLTFEDDFEASAGPGLFVYLSNSPTSIAGGLEVGSIQSSRGEQTYVIDLEDARLFTYNYVLVWCKPFGVLFGYGELDN